MLDVDPQGLDVMDRKLLEAVIHRFDGGPVGLDNVAAAIGEERDTIEDVIEPYLIQQGYLQRTPRGRVADAGGVPPPRRRAAAERRRACSAPTCDGADGRAGSDQVFVQQPAVVDGRLARRSASRRRRPSTACASLGRVDDEPAGALARRSVM